MNGRTGQLKLRYSIRGKSFPAVKVVIGSKGYIKCDNFFTFIAAFL